MARNNKREGTDAGKKNGLLLGGERNCLRGREMLRNANLEHDDDGEASV